MTTPSATAKQAAADGVSVVIPAYHSAATLPGVVEELFGVLPELTPEFEIILVDDGSQDGTWSAIEDLAARYPQVRGIELMRNYGQHNAILCGIQSCVYPVTVTMDDDLQHPAAEIPHLLEVLAGEYDVVYGTPVAEKHEMWRAMASRFTKLALRSSMGVETAQKVSAFRAFRTQVRNAFPHRPHAFVSIDVLLTWASSRFAAVRVDHRPRPLGDSNYTVFKLIRHALDMLTGFSTLPLQFASGLGFVLTGFGVLILVFVMGRYLLSGTSMPGFPFLASIIAIFSGAQLFAIGIVGEYLARMHFRLMERPSFVVRTTSDAMEGNRDGDSGRDGSRDD
jgi:undecaprenyl-phosphate 4-deoxy-4-formamido-L-arabinose transferase